MQEQAALRRLAPAEVGRDRVAPDRHRLARRVDQRARAGGVDHHAGLAGERADQHDAVHLVRGVQHLQRAHRHRAGIAALGGDVDRVLRRGVGRDQAAQVLLQGRRERRHRQVVRRQRVRHPRAAAAGHGDDADAPTARRLAGQQRPGDRHRLVRVVGLQDAILAEHGAVRRVGARQRGGVRGGGALARLGVADLDGNDRLATRARLRRRGDKARSVADRLAEQHNRVRAVVAGHVVQEVGEGEVGLVPGGHDIAEAQSGRLAPVEQRKADAARLRDDADAPVGDQRGRSFVRLRFHRGAEGGADPPQRVPVAFAVRAGDAQPGAAGDVADARLHLRRGAALLGKAGADDDHVLDAGARAFLRRGRDRACGDCDHRHVDRLAGRVERWVAAQPADLLVARIHRHDAALEPVVAQVAQQQAADAVRVGGRAEHRDRSGPEEALKHMTCHRVRLVGLRLASSV